jgi:hypothetical protein
LGSLMKNEVPKPRLLNDSVFALTGFSEQASRPLLSTHLSVKKQVAPPPQALP